MSQLLAFVHSGHFYLGYGLIFLWLNQAGGGGGGPTTNDIIPQWRRRRR